MFVFLRVFCRLRQFFHEDSMSLAYNASNWTTHRGRQTYQRRRIFDLKRLGFRRGNAEERNGCEQAAFKRKTCSSSSTSYLMRQARSLNPFSRSWWMAVVTVNVLPGKTNAPCRKRRARFLANHAEGLFQKNSLTHVCTTSRTAKFGTC